MSARAVLDTNVLISALVAERGAPRQVLDAWLGDQFILVTSLCLIEQLARVLSYPRVAERLRLSEEELATVLNTLLVRSEVTPGRIQLPGPTRDPKDDPVVACAVEGRVDYIVSGDLDLLILGQYESVQMVTPARFVELISAAPVENSDAGAV